MDQSRNWKNEDEDNLGRTELGGEPIKQESVVADDSAGPNEPLGSGHNPKKPSKAGSEAKEWIKALVIAGILVFVIRWLLVSPFIVDGESMEPNFQNRERIIVNKILYKIRDPKPGEVIVFHVPEESRDFIKRVIAVPGDTVRVEGDTVYVNDKPLDEPYLKKAIEAAHAEGHDYNDTNFPNAQFPEGTVPENTLFVMGDNRPNSKDSRMIGYIPMDHVVGRAELIFWPAAEIKYIGRGY
ncbi:signal peptidase I [Cohnella thailandensis]|jgi:signal peptidase I, bacterial type|uniref:Signal peptidase I n=1 Tax=Cohnella thailandensis TaxID=557557 RepID=A0A841T490_9BACL|nr:signal peptidase I [Cohnella thailandensis]MBB6636677.1 signal peptidase I [Cohnella thailandensis]MBP1973447.1 signal peptidase I [Cohnella thailandensis]